MPRTKKGKKITWKEFMKRWGEGIEGITPMQQVKMQIQSTYIVIIGLLCGIVICLIGLSNLWWLLIILLGGLGNTLTQLIGMIQKRNMMIKYGS